MATISCSFESKYSMDSYEDMIKTYSWLKNCLEYVFLDVENLKISESFSFRAGKIEFNCSSLNELKENAFGHEIQPLTLVVHAMNGYEYLGGFFTRRNPEQDFQEISLTSENKSNFISIQESLKFDEGTIAQKFSAKKTEQSVTITNCNINSDLQIVNQAHVSNANVNQANGSNANVNQASNNQTNTITTFGEKTTKVHWYSKLFWQILIPIGVGVAIIAISLWLKSS